MAVVIETTLGDITVDLFVEERPTTCLNFVKLCKIKYYNFCLFHSMQKNFISQSGDPSGSGKEGHSIFYHIKGKDAKFYEAEKLPKLKHDKIGIVSMVNCGDGMLGSQFFITLGKDLQSLDGEHCVFGEVSEGHEVLRKFNEVICDQEHRPYQDIRITHTVILEDPFDDPPGLQVPDCSPGLTKEALANGRIAPDEEIDETAGLTVEEVEERQKFREAQAQATILEIVGDLPDANIAPPENVLFVCKLNPVTTDDDLEIIFSRFGKIVSCEVIRDQNTGDSLQYAFVEFDNRKACEDAFFKMDNVLIDDRRIHVDFSQSVSKLRWKGKGRGVEHLDNEGKVKQDGHHNHMDIKTSRRDHLYSHNFNKKFLINDFDDRRTDTSYKNKPSQDQNKRYTNADCPYRERHSDKSSYRRNSRDRERRHERSQEKRPSPRRERKYDTPNDSPLRKIKLETLGEKSCSTKRAHEESTSRKHSRSEEMKYSQERDRDHDKERNRVSEDKESRHNESTNRKLTRTAEMKYSQERGRYHDRERNRVSEDKERRHDKPRNKNNEVREKPSNKSYESSSVEEETEQKLAEKQKKYKRQASSSPLRPRKHLRNRDDSEKRKEKSKKKGEMVVKKKERLHSTRSSDDDSKKKTRKGRRKKLMQKSHSVVKRGGAIVKRKKKNQKKTSSSSSAASTSSSSSSSDSESESSSSDTSSTSSRRSSDTSYTSSSDNRKSRKQKKKPKKVMLKKKLKKISNLKKKVKRVQESESSTESSDYSRKLKVKKHKKKQETFQTGNSVERNVQPKRKEIRKKMKQTRHSSSSDTHTSASSDSSEQVKLKRRKKSLKK